MAFLSLPVQAQPPLVGRPPNFSGAVGVYEIQTTIAPNQAKVEHPITLTVKITGKAEGQRPQRDLLKLFPSSMEDDFFIEPLPEKDIIDGNAWVFAFKLRPKHLKVERVPSLQFVYWDPSQRRYQPARSQEIELTVKPNVAEVVTPVQPLVIPPGFEKVYSTPGDVYAWSPPIWTTPGGIATAFLLPPVCCFLGYQFWKRRERKQGLDRQRRYSQAAQRALSALQGLERGYDGERLAGILGGYVQERLDLPVREPTADDVALALRRRRVERKIIQQARAAFQAVDGVRFAQTEVRERGIDAKELITFIGKVEEALCSTRRS